jgi:DNA polymerase III subunit gamma/tau
VLRGSLIGVGCYENLPAEGQRWVRTIKQLMTYQVLARKYRPQQFDDIIAQEHVTRTLQNGIKSGRISSGYLFTGPRGTGKTTTARVLAKALNCTEGPTPTPCDKCPSCIEIIAGSSLDVLEIDAASNTGVDDIRTLRENVQYMPTSGKKRIYIIDEVHRLSGSAFDALLKTLEEPPPHVVFMLATTEPQKVPPTIRSRTQQYDFHRVTVSNLSDHLKNIAEAEKIEIDDDALFILARKAAGSVRDAMSLLDQISAYAGEKIEISQVIDALGLIDNRFYFEYVEAIAAKDSATGLEKIKELIDSGVELPEFCAGLAEHLRQLLIIINSNNPERLLELSESEMENFQKQSGYFSSGDLLRLIKIVNDMTLDLKSGLDYRLILETGTLMMASMESTILFEEILAHLSQDEEPMSFDDETDLFGAPIKAAAPVSNQEKTAEETGKDIVDSPAATTPIRAINKPIVETGWPKFIEFLKRENPMLSALLAMADIKDVNDNIITAVFHNAGGTSKQVVEKSNYQTTILSALREFYKTNLKIRFEIDQTVKPANEPKPAPKVEKLDTEKILAEDERLRNIVEKFDGEIVGRKKADE